MGSSTRRRKKRRSRPVPSSRQRQEVIKDLEGQRFGRLLVVGLSHTQGAAYWKCICDCGNEIVVRSNHLVRGNVRSCGCLLRDINANRDRHFVGQRINNLTLLEKVQSYKSGRASMPRWLCRCDCGKETIVTIANLRGKRPIKGCGCLIHRKGQEHPSWRGGANKRNAWRKSEEYKAWRKRVLERDLQTCQICGLVSESNHAHHIQEARVCWDSRFNINNGVTLCVTCHGGIHRRSLFGWGAIKNGEKTRPDEACPTGSSSYKGQ